MNEAEPYFTLQPDVKDLSTSSPPCFALALTLQEIRRVQAAFRPYLTLDMDRGIRAKACEAELNGAEALHLTLSELGWAFRTIERFECDSDCDPTISDKIKSLRSSSEVTAHVAAVHKEIERLEARLFDLKSYCPKPRTVPTK